MIEVKSDNDEALAALVAEQRKLKKQIEEYRGPAVQALSRLKIYLNRTIDTGQSRKVAAFLGALYNGYDYTFTLVDLRGLDLRLKDDCLAVLRYDALGQEEIHTLGVFRDKELHRWLAHNGVTAAS